MKDGAQPVFKKKRNVSFAALEQINKELDRLEQAGILSKTDFSEWAAPTVHVKKKSNQIQICADFSTGLKDALQDHHYPLPSPEEIFNKLNGEKIFSKTDLPDAYLRIEVDEESSKLLCIEKLQEYWFMVKEAKWKKNRKKTLGSFVRPKLTSIMDSSSTILHCEITLSESSIVIP